MAMAMPPAMTRNTRIGRYPKRTGCMTDPHSLDVGVRHSLAPVAHPYGTRLSGSAARQVLDRSRRDRHRGGARKRQCHRRKKSRYAGGWLMAIAGVTKSVNF